MWRKQRSSCRGGGEDEILSRLGFPRSISRSVKLQTGWGVFVHPLCAGGRARGSPSWLAPEGGGFSSLPRTSLVQKQNIPRKAVRAPCRLISAIRGDQEVSMPGLGTEDRILSWVMSCVSASCCLGAFQPGIGSAAEAPLPVLHFSAWQQLPARWELWLSSQIPSPGGGKCLCPGHSVLRGCRAGFG